METVYAIVYFLNGEKKLYPKVFKTQQDAYQVASKLDSWHLIQLELI